MEAITKKRLKAIFIDSLISSAVSFGAEYLLRKQIKGKEYYAIGLHTAIQYGLEYAQLKSCGQTIGYRTMGIRLENEDGSELTGNQILKRMMHRDTTSTIDYFRDRENFEAQNGAILPHDRKTGTIVKEV